MSTHILQPLSLPDVLIFNIQIARSYLEHLLSLTNLLSTYRACFPEAFQRDSEQGVSLFPAHNADYSAFEVNFFHLVNEHYFPLPMDWWPDDPFGERRMAEYIPIESLGLDLYEEDLYENLYLGWQLLLYLLGEVDAEWLRECTTEEVSEALFEIPIDGGKVNERVLKLRCEAQGGPIAFLALALQMLRNDTASVWLNVTGEEPCLEYSWTKEEMEQLKEEYLLAKEIDEKATAFTAWLESDPCSHFAAVVRLWNSCVRDTPQRATVSRIYSLTRQDWVDGLHYQEEVDPVIALPAPRLVPDDTNGIS